MRDEKKIKNCNRKWKIDLIEKTNPNWNDLAESWASGSCDYAQDDMDKNTQDDTDKNEQDDTDKNTQDDTGKNEQDDIPHSVILREVAESIYL
jgi:hypothetical protein